MTNARTPSLAPELRSLVNQTISVLGRVIQHELGQKAFSEIEGIRQKMAALREAGEEDSRQTLQDLMDDLSKGSRERRRNIAKSFTLMLELMNACENAYRSHRLGRRQADKEQPHEMDAIVYVLTAHPTEARAPGNISVFHEIQTLLIEILEQATDPAQFSLSVVNERNLRHLVEIAWRTPIVRQRRPSVEDEADHVYSLALRPEVLDVLLAPDQNRPTLYLRSWVGGDKDGHQGVDEKAFAQSLSLSRNRLISEFLEQLKRVRKTLELFPATKLRQELRHLDLQTRKVRRLSTGDGARIEKLRKGLATFSASYEKELGAIHPALRRLRRLLHAFPGLVIPLEMREASDVLMDRKKGPKPAIERMFLRLKAFSRGGDPRWYVRGFIVSMTEAVEHIVAAAQLQKKIFASTPIPVIPLFETPQSLADSPTIVREMTKEKLIRHACKNQWNSLLEIMVGYSDSSKLGGVLPSRLAIAEALPKLEAICLEAGLTPVFFHGSGGSIDRGGGSIEEQTAWWPKSALKRYKVTVQGEMVERSFASSEITHGQIRKIAQSATAALNNHTRTVTPPELHEFAERIRVAYGEQIGRSEFLLLVEKATPYSYLDVLRIGSRPVKRTQTLSVSGLRAIPWVLCWTQMRILLPTWWGVGTAWTQTSSEDKQALRKAFQQTPVFQSYIKALGFTLSKIEWPIWRLALENSDLSDDEVQQASREFRAELERTERFFAEITEQREWLWFRPWLAESIRLRSPMIHPLNVLQLIAHQEKDDELLRLTVTGISSGMLTTG